MYCITGDMYLRQTSCSRAHHLPDQGGGRECKCRCGDGGSGSGEDVETLSRAQLARMGYDASALPPGTGAVLAVAVAGYEGEGLVYGAEKRSTINFDVVASS